MWLPNAIQTWHIIIARTYFKSTMPKELFESAQIDGCSNTRYIVQVVVPCPRRS